MELEVWSNYEAAGGQREAELWPVVSCRFTTAMDGSDELSAVIPESLAPIAPRGKVIRVTRATGDVFEYRVRSRRRVLGSGLREIEAESVRDELGRAGVITQTVAGVTSIDVGGIRTVEGWLDDVVLPFLAARGYPYFVRGVVAWAAPVTLVASGTGYTALSLLLALADATGYVLRTRRVGGTQVAIDFLGNLGALAPLIPVAAARNLVDLAEVEEDDGLVSSLMPLGDVVDGRRATIAENAWRITLITGAGPYWLTLEDPAGAAPPIGFAGQFGTGPGAQAGYLLTKTAATVQITDSRVLPSNAVQVASTTGLAVGDLVQIVADTNGARLLELANPSVVERNAKVGDFTGGGARNLALDGRFAEWTDLVTPAWYTKGASPAAFQTVRYPRDTPVAITADCTWVNANAVAVTGAPAFAILFRNESVRVGAVSYIVAATVQLDGTGAGTVTTVGTIGSFVGTRTFTLQTISCRPAGLPDDGGGTAGNAMLVEALTTGQAWPPASPGTDHGVRSTPFTVKYLPGLASVCAAVGWTVKLISGALSNLDSNGDPTDDPALCVTRHLPGVALRRGTTVAAYAVAGASVSVPGTTAHYNLACQTTITTDTSVDVIAYPGTAGLGSAGFVLRYVLLWLGSGEVPPAIGDQPLANALWQRGNRELAARQLGVRTITVTLRELATVLGYLPSGETLVLGGSLLLEDVGATVRVVAIQYDALDEANTRVTLDSRPASLVRYLAERT